MNNQDVYEMFVFYFLMYVIGFSILNSLFCVTFWKVRVVKWCPCFQKVTKITDKTLIMCFKELFKVQWFKKAER